MTFTKAFKDVFSEYLTQHGFEWCSKLRRFVKVINSELILYVGYRNWTAEYKGDKRFWVMAGIFSVYFFRQGDWTKECSDEKLFKFAFTTNGVDIFKFAQWQGHGEDFLTEHPSYFEYKKDDEKDMIKRTYEAAVATNKWILPVLDKVTDLKSYVTYAKKYSLQVLGACDHFMDDSITLILTDNHDDFHERFERQPESEKELARKGIKELYTDPRDRVYNDPELMKNALEVAEKNKEFNLRMLNEFSIRSE
jgi:hypothetical protein